MPNPGMSVLLCPSPREIRFMYSGLRASARRSCAAREEASSARMRAISPPVGRTGEGDVGGRGGEVECACCIKGDERADCPGESADADSASVPLLALGDSSLTTSL